MVQQVDLKYSEYIWTYFRPTYPAWLIANVLFLAIFIWQFREVTVEPGQGGLVKVFIWPSYWAEYRLQDAMALAVPEYSMWALLSNYVFGIVPLYVATNTGVNALAPRGFKTWRPSLNVVYLTLGIFLYLIVGYIQAHLFGYLGVVFWTVSGSTLLVTVAVLLYQYPTQSETPQKS